MTKESGAPGAKSKLLRSAAATVAVGGLAAGCSSGSGASGGSPTPQAAATKLYADISSGNYGAAAQDLGPDEAAALHEPLDALTAQLVRLGVLAPGTSLEHVPGISVEVHNPTYSVQKITDDVDLLTFTAGSVTASVDASKAPVGPAINRFVTGTPAPMTQTTQLNSAGNKGIAVQHVNGHWYVSLGYTIAENAVRSGSGSKPDLSQTIASAGASSPDAAVGDFLDDAAKLDTQSLLALTPPGELSAARTYASLFENAAKQGEAALNDEFDVKVDKIAFSDHSEADGTLVKLTTLDLSGNIAGQSFTFSNGCVTVAGVQVCLKNLGQLLQQGGEPQAATNIANLFTSLKPDLGFVTVKEDGKWYVSPTRTIVDNTTAVLKAMTPAQLQTVINDATGG